MPTQLGYAALQVVAAFEERVEWTLDELAVRVYGELDQYTRQNVQNTITRLKDNRRFEFESKRIYVMKKKGRMP